MFPTTVTTESKCFTLKSNTRLIVLPYWAIRALEKKKYDLNVILDYSLNYKTDALNLALKDSLSLLDYEAIVDLLQNQHKILGLRNGNLSSIWWGHITDPVESSTGAINNIINYTTIADDDHDNGVSDGNIMMGIMDGLNLSNSTDLMVAPYDIKSYGNHTVVVCMNYGFNKVFNDKRTLRKELHKNIIDSMMLTFPFSAVVRTDLFHSRIN